MGLITGLLTLPLAPVRGVGWIAEQIEQQAFDELYDEHRIMREIAAAELAHENGEMDEAEMERQVDGLLERLQEGRRLRQDRGLDG